MRDLPLLLLLIYTLTDTTYSAISTPLPNVNLERPPTDSTEPTDLPDLRAGNNNPLQPMKFKMNKKAAVRDGELESGVMDPRTKELGISQEGREVDAVFGALNEDGPNYRDVSGFNGREWARVIASGCMCPWGCE